MGKAFFIDREYIEAVEVEPLRSEFADESEEIWIIDQAINFGVELLSESAVFGESSEFLIGR